MAESTCQCYRAYQQTLTTRYWRQISPFDKLAGVRDPDNASSKALLDLPHGKDSTVIVLKIDSVSETDALAAINTLKSDAKLTKLDVVIANAGISNYFGKATATPAQEMFEHFKVNAVAPLLLFQATAPLLDAATEAKFAVISSGAGSISNIVDLPVENTAYGSSKAAVNFVTRRIHYENPNLIAFPVNPGWLQTDLGNHAASGAGMAKALVIVEDGVKGIVNTIDNATREKTSGTFMNSDSGQWP